MFEKVQVVDFDKNGDQNKIKVIPLITEACVNCSKSNCVKRGNAFYVANPNKIELKIGNKVELKIPLKFQIAQAIFALLLPVAMSVVGYLLMPPKESLQVLGVLAGFGITTAITTLLSRYIHPQKSEIVKICHD